jgi:hypothetical protein
VSDYGATIRVQRQLAIDFLAAQEIDAGRKRGLAPIREAMEKFTFMSKPEIIPDWVSNSWARGAAALATQNIFDFQRSPSG